MVLTVLFDDLKITSIPGAETSTEGLSCKYGSISRLYGHLRCSLYNNIVKWSGFLYANLIKTKTKGGMEKAEHSRNIALFFLEINFMD